VLDGVPAVISKVDWIEVGDSDWVGRTVEGIDDEDCERGEKAVEPLETDAGVIGVTAKDDGLCVGGV